MRWPRFSLAGGKSAAILAIAGGLLGWFNAPYNFWWLGFICFPVLLWQLEGTRGWQAFLRGWMFGFGYFVLGLYWIAQALFVDISQFWWALPLAVAGLPFVLAIYTGVATWLTQRWGGQGLSRILFLALSWSVLEWLRGHLFTGFPWLLAGYMWIDISWVRQFAALTGAYGLSLWVVWIWMLPYALLKSARASRSMALIMVLALLAVGVGWANYWLRNEPTGQESTIKLRLIQPNIAQSMKMNPGDRERIMTTLLDLTRLPGTADAVIWPESAIPYRLEEQAGLRTEIAKALPENSMLLTGAVRREAAPSGEIRYFNSLVAMNHQGDITGAYDKAHLVPFGEYIPFRQWLPFDPIAGGVDFSAGQGPALLKFAHLPALNAMVCYEAIFPGAITQQGQPPFWLLNITNDAWYGLTHGPYQHAEIARLRAVEEGVPLVRVANSGITFVANAQGYINAALRLGMAGTVDVDLQLWRLPTPYARYGDMTYVILLIICALIWLIARAATSNNNRT